MLMKVLKESLSKIDCLLLAAATFIFLTTPDYSNLTTDDKIYLGVFAIWIIMLAVRIFIKYRNEGARNNE